MRNVVTTVPLSLTEGVRAEGVEENSGQSGGTLRSPRHSTAPQNLDLTAPKNVNP
jgi:hypothetical protein